MWSATSPRPGPRPPPGWRRRSGNGRPPSSEPSRPAEAEREARANERAREIFARRGKKHALARALRALGMTIELTGDKDVARRHCTEALNLFERLGLAQPAQECRGRLSGLAP